MLRACLKCLVSRYFEDSELKNGVARDKFSAKRCIIIELLLSILIGFHYLLVFGEFVRELRRECDRIGRLELSVINVSVCACNIFTK